MGAFEAVDALLEVTPNRTGNATPGADRGECALSGQRQRQGCSLVAARVRDNATDYWQKALIFCQVLANQVAQASLGVSLLREAKVDDPPFFALVDALIAGAGKTAAPGSRPRSSTRCRRRRR